MCRSRVVRPGSSPSPDRRRLVTAARTQELQEQLSRREADMADMEERYKKYLEKAKSVIRSLDTKVGSPDVSVLRHQVSRRTGSGARSLCSLADTLCCCVQMAFV